MDWYKQIIHFDKRRNIVNPGDRGATLSFCVDHWIAIAQESIGKRDAFYVALSGGSTPKVVYQALEHNKEKVDWSKVFLFWSDERCVPPTDPESNYKMSMDYGFGKLAIPKEHIFRMKGELKPEVAAKEYNKIIEENVPDGFDLIMLGMGEDGHTASLFPDTKGLHENNKLAIANYIPQKDSWRLTLTFECINQARNSAIYVLGEDKADMLKLVLAGKQEPDELPAQRVGTPEHPSLWIVDDAAYESLKKVSLKK